MTGPTDQPETGRPRARCPRRMLALLALGYWVFALLNVGRAWQAHRNIDLLARWQPAWPWWILIIVSALFALAFLAAGWGLVCRRSWGRDVARWLPPVYGLVRIVTVLLASATPYARGRWVPLLAGWALATLLVGWLLGPGPLRRCFRPGASARPSGSAES